MTRPLTLGSLFSGIGGFELGFERTGGFKTVWEVEIDPYCRKVLERHFPHAERFADIRDCCGSHGWAHALRCPIEHHLRPVDVICGGFPCQDISTAGKRAGIDGERSGLWSEMHRIICELRPRFVVVENVAALLNFGVERVLGDLAASGYDAEWRCLRASDFGALHRRDRIWIVAYPEHDGPYESENGRGNGADVQRPESAERQNGTEQFEGVRHPRVLAYPVRDRHVRPATTSAPAHNGERTSKAYREERRDVASSLEPDGKDVSDSNGAGCEEQRRPESIQPEQSPAECGRALCDPASEGLPDWAGGTVGQPRPLTEFERPSGREVELSFCGVAHGVSRRVDRLKGLGNAIVPQIAEWIGTRILEVSK